MMTVCKNYVLTEACSDHFSSLITQTEENGGAEIPSSVGTAVLVEKSNSLAPKK